MNKVAECKITELFKKTKQARGNDEIKSLLDDVDILLGADLKNLELLRLSAELNIKLQKFGDAINNLNNILSILPDDRAAKVQIEQLQTILKYNNTDIYANPNTHFDPWLD